MLSEDAYGHGLDNVMTDNVVNLKDISNLLIYFHAHAP